ncbi:MAG TPA: two-component system sensor histidine kinase DcuS, partial [Sporomusaceae bacterium]|nr:two-component system sensor histidine kinase DcuS [Sporomusaceae bacterium]
QCYDQLAGYISGIAHQYQAEVGFVVRRIKDPVLAGFLLGKLSHAREAGVNLILSENSFLPEPADQEVIPELVTIVGNLVNNAFEAVADSTVKYIKIACNYNEGRLLIEVSDSGAGMAEEQKNRLFTKGYSTKANNRGLGLFLVQHSLARIGGGIEVFSEKEKGTRFVVSVPYLGVGDNNND